MSAELKLPLAAARYRTASGRPVLLTKQSEHYWSGIFTDEQGMKSRDTYNWWLDGRCSFYGRKAWDLVERVDHAVTEGIS